MMSIIPLFFFADLLPIDPQPEETGPSPVIPVIIALTAAAVIAIVIIRRKKRK